MGIFQKIRAWDKKNAEHRKISQLEKIKVKCPLCKEQIPSTALRCSHCAGDLTTYRGQMDDDAKKAQRTQLVVGVIVIAIIVGIFIIAISSEDNDGTTTKTPIHTGDHAVLHMNESPDSVVFIATTEESYDELMKTLSAHDTVGMLQLGMQNKAFGVTNGSKVLVIDRAFMKRKVRILEGVKQVDKDKIGLAGWIPEEWLKVTERK